MTDLYQTTIVWVHGWGCPPDVWAHLADDFPIQKHLYFDYSGCTDVNQFHIHLDRLIAQSQPDEKQSLILVGWSLGGMLVLDYLIRQSEQVRSIERVQTFLKGALLVSTSLCFCADDRSLGWPPHVLRQMISRIRDGRADHTVRRFQQRIGISPKMTEYSNEVLCAGLEYLLQTDLRASWEMYAQTLVARVEWLHGSGDDICPFAALPSQVRQQVHVLDNAGHVPFLTHPEEVVTLLRRILARD